MNEAELLWSLNAVAALLAGIWTRYVLIARSRRGRRSRYEILDDALAELDDGLPSEAELRTAWSAVIDKCSTFRDADDIALIRVAVLYDSDSEAVGNLRRLCTNYVNKLNNLAELVDDGFVRPKDICRLHPQLHFDLLISLHLVEPMIWYDSAVNARGRWGYRVAQLRMVLEALRPVSTRARLHSGLSIDEKGLNLGRLNELSRLRLLVRRAVLLLRTPTINMSSKKRQTIYERRLSRDLSHLGVSISRPEYVIKAVEW